ncbi:MAG TPA: carboxyl transferase domain-containing protein, partial [Candidatus Kapabacteria bacterium]|nr:carboxyl transferase domain-containing protein [Candidatus Kapabacteria bacterium]
MPVYESLLNPAGDEFKANADQMLKLVQEFRAIEESVMATEAKAKPKFDKRGQLLPRERINRLLDPGSPFLELMSLAGHLMHDDRDGSSAGGGIIAGIGYVEGIRCMVVANNSAVKGGTISPAGLHKSLRLQEIVAQNKLPTITLSESGGANLNYAGEIFVEGARTFANQARLSAAGIPQITVVHGNATAGGAYQPGLSDYIIAVRKRTKMFLAGPPLLKAATGEIAHDEDLGGAEMHAQVSGTAEYLAENDADGIRLAREILRMIPWNDALPTLTKKA